MTGQKTRNHRPAYRDRLSPAATNAAIWFNWQIDAPVKRSLIAYDH